MKAGFVGGSSDVGAKIKSRESGVKPDVGALGVRSALFRVSCYLFWFCRPITWALGPLGYLNNVSHETYTYVTVVGGGGQSRQV